MRQKDSVCKNAVHRAKVWKLPEPSTSLLSLWTCDANEPNPCLVLTSLLFRCGLRNCDTVYHKSQRSRKKCYRRWKPQISTLSFSFFASLFISSFHRSFNLSALLSHFPFPSLPSFCIFLSLSLLSSSFHFPSLLILFFLYFFPLFHFILRFLFLFVQLSIYYFLPSLVYFFLSTYFLSLLPTFLVMFFLHCLFSFSFPFRCFLFFGVVTQSHAQK
jgi:hypothetical protein